MAKVTVRGVVLGEGRCKVIAPIMAATAREAAAQARKFRGGPADIAELRLDPLLAAGPEEPEAALAAVRRELGHLPILATVRTAAEGGEADLTDQDYRALLLRLMAGGQADLLDIEAARPSSDELLAAAHAAHLPVIFSCHHFDSTPPEAEMVETLCQMSRRGADIAKLAVMPRDKADAARLLLATARAAAALPGQPLITMAMGEAGLVTRLCGSAFGNAASFGVIGAGSAPGQPEAAALRRVVEACLEAGL